MLLEFNATYSWDLITTVCLLYIVKYYWTRSPLTGNVSSFNFMQVLETNL